MSNHNNNLVNLQPQDGWRSSANIDLNTNEEVLYYPATLANSHNYPHSQPQAIPLYYPQAQHLPPSNDHYFGPHSGNFPVAFYGSTWTVPPPLQNLNQYPTQQLPNQLPFPQSSRPPTAPPITIPNPILRDVGTEATRIAADNRRGPSSDAKFVCSLCQSSFTAKHNLKYHLRAHLSERPFPCDICPETAFTAKSDLRRHEKSKKHAAQLRFIQGGVDHVII
ncbi:hypothetical protein AB1N83_012861 [Pleurotus pulmonarius]